MSGQWRDGPVPHMVIGQWVEHWLQNGEGAWFQVVGPVIELEGEPGMDPTKATHMEFHDEGPPHPSEGHQLWRIVPEGFVV